MDTQNPYSAPQSTVSYDAKDASIEYIGFWGRVGASIIDNILLSLVTIPLLYMYYGQNYFITQAKNGIAAGGVDVLLSYVFPVVAIITFWIYKSATPGKMMIHAKIVDAETLQPTTSKRLFIRYFGYIVCIFTLFLGFVWIAFDKKKQGLHDKMARTVVIRSYD